MVKLKQNVIYFDPERGQKVLGRIGDDVPRELVANPDVFGDEVDETAFTPEDTSRDALDGLKVGELRELAVERDIDLTGANQKSEIIERIREADLV